MKKALIFSDIHVGSTAAPWPASTYLPDGGQHKPSAAQRYLNRCFATLVRDAEEQKPDIIIVLGDVIEGTHKKLGTVTNRRDGQVAAAVELLEPLRNVCDRMYLVAGTEFHTGNGQEDCRAVAEQLDCVQHPDTKSRIWPEMLIDTQFGVVHAAHHISSSSIPWGEATAPLRDLLLLQLEMSRAYARTGPKITGIIRAHRHRMVYVQTEDTSWALCLPSFQLHTEFSRRTRASHLPEVGYAWLFEDDDGVRVKPVRFRLPLPHTERL